MLNRRNFIHAAVALAAAPALPTYGKRSTGFGKLLPDPERILDLPEGFEYRVIARMGTEMSDGLLTPAQADGMAAFPGANGRINLVCNHENIPSHPQGGPFGVDLELLDKVDADYIYDYGDGKTPGNAGTSTIIYDPKSGSAEKQFLSLAGTELNCAGGPTPWGSWLTCEEAFSDPGPAWEYSRRVDREQYHGYVFEVPSSASGLVKPVPIKDMGRFEHEAAGVDPKSGAIYMSEDRHRSLFYRFLPNEPGNLQAGGKLQALAIKGSPQYDTRNWIDEGQLKPDVWLDVEWVDLDDVDTTSNDLRLRGFDAGAARFARGEGLWFADGSAFLTCTIGGAARLGQIFEYRVSPYEGTEREAEKPGAIRLLAEAASDSLLRNCDNLTMSPWGDLVVCEDTGGNCGLVGVTTSGEMYPVAYNAYTDSELAGVCFAPDGRTLFVNIQEQGLTVAINGPW